jgi:hypothetical protein
VGVNELEQPVERHALPLDGLGFSEVLGRLSR